MRTTRVPVRSFLCRVAFTDAFFEVEGLVKIGVDMLLFKTLSPLRVTEL
jgi:hypothetical protein